MSSYVAWLRNKIIYGVAGHLADHVALAGTEDLRFPASGINPAGGASAPTVDTTTYPGTSLFSASAINLIAGVAQIPHGWKKGTAVRSHVHWQKTTSAAGTVVWEFCYAMKNTSTGVFSGYTAWEVATSTTGVPENDIAEKEAISKWSDIVMTDRPESTVILWQMRRKADAAGDTYAAVARFLEFDIHHTVSKFGTVIEIPT